MNGRDGGRESEKITDMDTSGRCSLGALIPFKKTFTGGKENERHHSRL